MASPIVSNPERQVAPSAAPDPSPNAQARLFYEIAATASAAADLLDDNDCGSPGVAASHLVRWIGALADRGRALNGDMPARGGTDEWLAPFLVNPSTEES